MKNLISHLLFPLTFGAGLFIALVGLDEGVSGDVLVAAISVGTFVVVAAFERILPEHPDWNIAQGDVQTDLLHGLVSMVMLPQILQVAMRLGLLHVAVQLAEFLGGGVWPVAWPLWAQLVLALIISQFFEYWAHRLLHEIPLLWRFHATHHSPRRLYWLNAGRFHPVDSALLHVVGMGPLMLLGAGAEVMALYTIWVAMHGTFQHCNIRVRLGALNYVFSMAELHRWHHSLKLDEANANYGNNILLWDLVFGTVHYPRDAQASSEIGLSDNPDFPGDYLGQVLSPFRWKEKRSGK